MNSDVVLPKWDDVLKGRYLYTAMGHERMRHVETYARACIEADRKARPGGGEESCRGPGICELCSRAAGCCFKGERDCQGSPLPLAAEMPIDLLAAHPSACELGAVRELAKAWRARADACVDDFNSGVSTREVTVMRDLADELEAALQQRGDSRGGEVGRD